MIVILPYSMIMAYTLHNAHCFASIIPCTGQYECVNHTQTMRIINYTNTSHLLKIYMLMFLCGLLYRFTRETFHQMQLQCIAEKKLPSIFVHTSEVPIAFDVQLSPSCMQERTWFMETEDHLKCIY